MHTHFALSHAGRSQTNEDAFLIMAHPRDENLLICALADGQGGRPGAQMAARLACKVAVESAVAYSPRQLTWARNWTRTWSKILGKADSAVYHHADAGVTTLVVLCVTKGAVYGASSGDSAAVLLNVYDQVHHLTEGQHKNPPIGSGAARAVFFQQRLIDPWRLVLMSDGVWKYTGWSRVLELIKRHGGEALLKMLAEAAYGDMGYRDDVTVVLVESGREGN